MPLSYLPTMILSDEIISGAKPVEFIGLDKTFMKASGQIVSYSNTPEQRVIPQVPKSIDYTLYDSLILDMLNRQKSKPKLFVDANHNESLESNAGRRTNNSYMLGRVESIAEDTVDNRHMVLKCILPLQKSRPTCFNINRAKCVLYDGTLGHVKFLYWVQ